jgi:ATP-dependent DNA helicase RecQ
MDLIDEIEAIVSSGTKLNIDYYLNEIMDDEKLEEIFEYFREAETESIDKALAELGEEYFTEEEIRLVRIKFFSELAN